MSLQVGHICLNFSRWKIVQKNLWRLNLAGFIALFRDSQTCWNEVLLLFSFFRISLKFHNYFREA